MLNSAKNWLTWISISRLLRWSLYVFVFWWVFTNWQQNIPISKLAAKYTYENSRFIEVDGMQVHIRIAGQGETMLLLHDENSSLHTWSDWTTSLSQKYQVISVDLPGAGLTGPHPRGSYSTFKFADFLDKLINVLGIKRIHLVGNGMGAQIAWFYAAEHSDNLKSLILLNAPGFEAKGGALINRLARTPVLNRIIWRITPRAFIRLMLEDIYADDDQVKDSIVDRHFELFLRPGNRKAFTDRASVSDNRPPVDMIEQIKTPTLILWGAEDTRLSPEFAYEFHRRIRGAFLKIYQNTGHWPQEENPQQTVQDVLAFLDGKF